MTSDNPRKANKVDLAASAAIAERRKKIKKSQQSVATGAGITYQSLGKYEAGARITLGRFVDLAHELEADAPAMLRKIIKAAESAQ